MTVAVACNLSEGVILGVDSAVTLPDPGGTGTIAKVYENAEKLFQLGEKAIGVAHFGLAALGSRGVGSYLREFEVLDPHAVVSGPASMHDVVEELRSFFMDVYLATVAAALKQATGKDLDDIPEADRPAFGLVVGGFSSNAYLSEVWQILIPSNTAPDSAQIQRAQGQFGTNWFATFEPIRRYLMGYDPALIAEIAAYFEQLRSSPLAPNETAHLLGILGKYAYQIPFDAMPMEEGVRHTRFLVELVINHHRYAFGAPIVGGKVKIGKVTYKGERFQILDDPARE